MEWGVYIETCLSFGLRLAPKLFTIIAEFLAWIAQQNNVSFLIHHLDDFLTIGPPSSLAFQHNLDTIIHICNYLGIHLPWKRWKGHQHPCRFWALYWIP